MSKVLLGVAILVLLLVALIVISRVRYKVRGRKWRQQEGGSEVELPGQYRLEYGYYRDGERQIGFELSWVGDTKIVGMRVHLHTFVEQGQRTDVEANREVVARVMSYLGYVAGFKTLKLYYESGPRPSEGLIRCVEERLSPIGFVRSEPEANFELTWQKPDGKPRM